MVQWRTVQGDTLLDALEGNRLGPGAVMECSAIYAWKRSFRAPAGARRSGRAAEKWIGELFATPLGTVTNYQISHYLRVTGLELTPESMTDHQRRTLRSMCDDDAKRRRLIKYVESLAGMTPSLYVGETGNLRGRIGEHISGETDFGVRVNDSNTISWSDLDLHYYYLGEAKAETVGKSARTTLETIATAMTISGWVSRRG